MKLIESSSEIGTSSNAFPQSRIHMLYLLQSISRVGSRTQCPVPCHGCLCTCKSHGPCRKCPPHCTTTERQGRGVDFEDPTKPTTGTDSQSSDIFCKARSESKGFFSCVIKSSPPLLWSTPFSRETSFRGWRRQRSKGD